jgi:hypothetical protein
LPALQSYQDEKSSIEFKVTGGKQDETHTKAAGNAAVRDHGDSVLCRSTACIR